MAAGSPPVIALVGPTGVGKTELALQLATQFEAEIVNADSRQVYRYLDIGSAKPTAAQRALVPHHLLDVVDPNEPFDCARYRQLALEAITDIHARGRRVLLVGGTGLYVKVLRGGLCAGPSRDAALRAQLEADEQAKAPRWIVPAVLLCVLLGAGTFVYARLNAAPEVQVARLHAPPRGGDTVVLNATGYIVAAHKIELASKVVGKVAWIGVDKGDRVKEGQVLVRLEDDEYRARLLEAQGQLNNLKARLAELEHGSRPEEIAKAKADLGQARATLEDARVTLDRTRSLANEGVMAKQSLDDAQAKYDSAAANAAPLEKAYELVRIGPRQEEIDAARAQVREAEGSVAFAQTELENTVIRAPVSGTILERNVEKGEFVTTGFVGDKGAKGYVVSLANLNDLQVELDISQNDFAKLHFRQPGIVTTDAFPDRKYQGYIEEIAPEANRQKATVQVKVKIVKPDDYLRPEMNASVAFVSSAKTAQVARPRIDVPAAAVRNRAVFVVLDGRAVRRSVQALIGGEDVIVNPPADLKDGQKVRPRQG